MEISRRTVVWLIPISLALHDAEEALAFRDALPRVRAALPPSLAALASRLTYGAIVQALVVLSILAFVLATVVMLRPASHVALWLLLTLETAIGVNAIAHLASAALVFRGYGPGLATALLINAPLACYCQHRARRDRWLSPAALCATVPAALVLHGPVLLGGLWLAASVGG